MPEMSMKQFHDKVQRWASQFPAMAFDAMDYAGREVHGEVVSKHLNGPKMARGAGSSTKGTLQPGKGSELKSSIAWRVKRAGGRVTGQVGNWKHPLVYAKIHEYGGIILPKKSKFLVFKIGDKTIFAKKVVIPERSFLRSSLKAKRQKIKDIFLKAIKRSYTNA